MEFDNIIESVCEASTEIDPATCKLTGGPGGGGGVIPPVPPSDDDRCADPAFYDANPLICAGYPRLILKPSSAICEPGKTVQYSTYVRTNGNEVLITAGLTYKVSDSTIAWIEPDAGLTTGVKVGTTTVSVKWQNLTAFAQLEVVESCSSLNNSYLILIDNSKSMTQAFSDTFASKLTFAKDAAKSFIDTTNFSKDSVAVAEFGLGGTIVQVLTQDKALAKAAVLSVVPTNEKTNIDDGLRVSIEYLNAATSGTKIIILLSDGENNGPTPLPRAQAFKDAGNIIVVIGIRCWGQYFDLLYKIATGGFFLSAYQATEGDVETTLDGLKSYICSGECAPTPGTYPKPQLDYFGFLNWDVSGAEDAVGVMNADSAYRVDLCGLGNYDVWPGHGLYVDMSGSTDSKLHIGSGSRLTSKVQFNFISGHQYSFKIKIAGYHRHSVTVNDTNKPIQITIGSLLSEQIVPTSIDMPFTQFAFTFTAGATSDENIIIEQIIAAGVRDTSYGTWVDEIVLEDLTAATEIFSDNFDDENPVTTPPDIGYLYGYGCLTTPPGAQSADPTPPETIIE